MKKFDRIAFVREVINKRFRVEFARKRHIGLREIGKDIGISASTVSRIINGKMIDIDSLILVCAWIEIDIDEFIIDTTKRKKH